MITIKEKIKGFTFTPFFFRSIDFPHNQRKGKFSICFDMYTLLESLLFELGKTRVSKSNKYISIKDTLVNNELLKITEVG
jgi:hypothetical protein